MTRERITREEQLNEARPNRVPIHEQHRNRLTITDKDPNYVYRVVNDIDNRVEQFKLAGYEIVEKTHKVGDVDSNNSVGSGTRMNVGSGRVGVLMRIKREFYEADQKAKQDEITRNENLLIRKKRKNDEADSDGNYGEVSISR